jgi:hypothetical protein
MGDPKTENRNPKEGRNPKGPKGGKVTTSAATPGRVRPAWDREAIALLPEAALGGVTALLTGGRGAAGGRDSSEPTPHRSCLGTEISTWVIQRDRRRILRWHCLDGG